MIKTMPVRAALVVFACSSLASAAVPQLELRQDAKLGSILTGDKGMTLYLYTKDTPGVTNCYGQCAAAWPPLLSDTLPKLPSGMPGKVTLVERKDGTQQVAYNGWPLYYWVRDQKAGDTTGQDVGKVWYAVNPGPPVRTAKNSGLGEYLVAPNGMTLYLYTRDEKNVSTCYDGCAAAWPPLLSAYLPAEKGSKLGTTLRKDGALQVTYDGKPLYFWARDSKPGDTTGQNVGQVWFVVKP
jgi:predicted lipoprotein with Yx(FWY)xxD motif